MVSQEIAIFSIMHICYIYLLLFYSRYEKSLRLLAPYSDLVHCISSVQRQHMREVQQSRLDEDQTTCSQGPTL